MKRHLIAAFVLAAFALPLIAQDASPDAVVATVNGEKITRAKLDQLWNRMSEKMRIQYMTSGGGKLGFLQNYVGKRLLLQSALNAGFDKSEKVQAELEAARESALFDLYVRDEIGSQFVTEEAIRKYYDDHRDEFSMPERALVRIIHIAKANHEEAEAKRLIANIMQRLFAARTTEGFEQLEKAFAAAAQEESEHPSAVHGGDLGWVTRSQLEDAVAEAVFTMKKGTMSGVIESDKGFQLILVEDRAAPSTQPYEAARAGIREYLMAGNVQRVMELVNKTTNELRAKGQVEVFAENVQ